MKRVYLFFQRQARNLTIAGYRIGFWATQRLNALDRQGVPHGQPKNVALVSGDFQRQKSADTTPERPKNIVDFNAGRDLREF